MPFKYGFEECHVGSKREDNQARAHFLPSQREQAFRPGNKGRPTLTNGVVKSVLAKECGRLRQSIPLESTAPLDFATTLDFDENIIIHEGQYFSMRLLNP